VCSFKKGPRSSNKGWRKNNEITSLCGKNFWLYFFIRLITQTLIISGDNQFLVGRQIEISNLVAIIQSTGTIFFLSGNRSRAAGGSDVPDLQK